ncbi:MAG: VCBS repeat-containing protein [Betaproteobacteria bacterium]|nr:VCBS repeat-containing protein [Betaproteobacteria bacterium]
MNRSARLILFIGFLLLAASAQAAQPMVGGCQVFPANNHWNTPIDKLPALLTPPAMLDNYLRLGSPSTLWPDWGIAEVEYGIPFVTVPVSQPNVPINYTAYGDESDPGPFPIPPSAPVEGGAAGADDRHVIVIETGNCILFELFRAFPIGGGASWNADSGARFDLKSNALRTDTWTSADAAGLPIFPGLVRWEEVAAGEINHAIRVTFPSARDTYIWPARHNGPSGNTSTSLPQYGMRIRLKADVDISGYRPDTQVLLRALKKYGFIFADQGSAWFFQGMSNPNWPSAMLSQIKSIVASGKFEVVDTSSLMVTPDSGHVRPSDPGPDVNADGKPDIIWSNTASGATYIWRMNRPALLSDSLLATIDPSWKIQGVADFDGDGHSDVVWRNTVNGNCYVWYLVNGEFQGDAFLFSLPPEWVIQGVADFNADGKPDFLMRNVVSGNAFAWFFNNNATIGDQFLFNIDPDWKVEGVADLSADGQPDLLFRSMTSGLSFAWNTQYSVGNLSLAASSPPIFGIAPVWEIAQVADWNGDGKPDLLFRNASTGLVFVWHMDGTTLTTSVYVTQIDPTWEIVPRR